MWIYLVIAFTAGEPIQTEMNSMQECYLAVDHAVTTAPHLTRASCVVRDVEWKSYI